MSDYNETEDSRLAYNSTSKQSDDSIQNIIRDVSDYLNRLAQKSERLIGNFTTNLAEDWMSIRMKFDGGKIINRCNRGSWHARCFGGALRKNLGPAWSPSIYQKSIGIKPGIFFCNTFRQKALKHKRSLTSQKKEEVAAKRRKRKNINTLENHSKKAKVEYGPGVLDNSPDITKERLHELCNLFLKRRIERTCDEIEQIENTTKDQSLSMVWKAERQIRLISSNFGNIMSRKQSNISNKIIKNLLYTSFERNIHTVRGLAQEQNTIIESKNQHKGSRVEKLGLVICYKYPYLAASTDGLIIDSDGHEGLLEVKNLLQSNQMSLNEATESKSFCLENVNGKLKLKRQHKFYYQVQGQLNIMNYSWCDFVVRRVNPYEMFVERIE